MEVLKSSNHHKFPVAGLDAKCGSSHCPQARGGSRHLSVFFVRCYHGPLNQPALSWLDFVESSFPGMVVPVEERESSLERCWDREKPWHLIKRWAPWGNLHRPGTSSAISLVFIGECTLPFSSLLEGIIYDLDITLLLMCWHFCFNNF